MMGNTTSLGWHIRVMTTSSLRQDEFPSIALGTMSLGANIAAARSLIQHAIDGGITTLDTADLYEYGQIETAIGQAISGIREKVYLISKGGNRAYETKDGWTWDPSPEYLEQALSASLRRLQTDYLDLYLLHGGTMDDPLDEVIEFMERKKSAGVILGYGISSIRPEVIRYWAENASLSAVMCQYSVLDRRPEEQIFPLLEKHQVPVLARGTFAKGMLVGKPPGPYLGLSELKVREIVTEFHPNPSSVEKDHAALSFALSNPAVATAVVGASSESQIDRLIQYKTPDSQWHWPEEFRRRLPANIYQQHRI